MSGGEQRGAKRIDLSLSQVVGGGLATLTAATAASFLGVYGTIIGAAVMSVISTAGTAVVQHLLSRSGEKARDLTGRRPPRARTPGAAPGGGAPGKGGVETLVDLPETRVLDAVPATRPFRPAEGDASADRTPTAPLPPGGEADSGAAEPGRASRWRRWRGIVLPAAALFLAAMALITAFELFSGRSLSDTVRGDGTSSSPSLLGGTGGGAAAEPTPDPGTGTGTGGPDATDEPAAPDATPAPDEGEGATGPGATTEPTDPATGDGTGGAPSQEQGGDGTGTGEGTGGTGGTDSGSAGTGEVPSDDQQDPAVQQDGTAPGPQAPR
ncbi:hypothetical protein [Marinitenerispora sediminis]|uniref:Uncharacterized protein n=1 Tax=Marinitenerispora sediminis TaxID=1931232 RepID=A0A368T3X4_9ACTN|nr:hypothetical protein [Marinitenerispora sediminis]RCV48940.1 hypothetical protein DEF28_22215 [Marinitenerispora sediminis]RCV57016.1 hypothetical protein DEF24_15835 [Marinitenerispora sediminis]RCV58635.1 hypothetical protein DEF23_08435 [Marinitenerispora sediminis]